MVLEILRSLAFNEVMKCFVKVLEKESALALSLSYFKTPNLLKCLITHVIFGDLLIFN